MKQVEKDVLAWIEQRQGELIAGLQRLVSIPSIVGSEGTCQQAVAEMMGASCDSVDVWEPDVAWLEGHPAYFPRGVDFKGRPNVVGVVNGKGGGRSLIVNAHADVVEPGPEEVWPHGPWSGTVADGRLYGRGSVDDKAGLAIMILLARCLHDLGLRLGGDLILESVADEEWGGGGTLSTLHKGYTADAAILFEATSLNICPAARGGQAFRVTVSGKGAHPIRSYEGVSALNKAIPLLSALSRLERDRQERFRNELFEPYPVFMPITVGTISADEFPSKVPERCVFQGLMGYSPDETYQQAREELELCIAETASTDPWLTAHPPLVEWIGLNKEGAQTSSDHPLVRLLDGSCVEITGVPATITGFTAGCDLPYLTNYGGMPSVIFGPGNPAIAHTSVEHLEIEELMHAAKILAISVLRWCGY